MSNEVELTRLKIAADVLAEIDRRTLFRSEAEDLDDIEDRLLALAGRLSASRDGDPASGSRCEIELSH